MRLVLADLELIQAANYSPVVGAPREVKLLVLHSMESQEKPGTARNVARWFAGDNAPQASAHYCIDNREIIRCVRDEDVAWHAPGANRQGIGLEMAGRAGQSGTEWMDAYSKAVIQLATSLAALLCVKHDIPARLVMVDGLLRGERGITTHAIVSKAWKKSSHWDPGPGFPLAAFVREVERKVRAEDANEGGKP